MALSILDGNQSATTLSSVVTGGEHIVAHSVVSLGSNAISNITTAISGSTVCVGNLGLLQSTVATEGLSASGSFIKIGGHTGTSTTGNIVHVSAAGAMRVDGSVYTQPVSIASVTIGNTVTIAGTVTANPTGTQTIAGTVTANAVGYNYQETSPALIPIMFDGSDRNYIPIGPSESPLPLPISGTVDITALPTGINRIGVVTIGGGTVTLGASTAQIGSVTASISGTVPVSISSVTVGNSVTIGNFPASQAVTFGQAIVSASNITGLNNSVGTDGNTPTSTNFIKIGGHQDGSNQVEHIVHVSAGGSMKVDASDSTVTFGVIRGTVTVGNSVTIGSLPAISGTVTASVSNFGVIASDAGNNAPLLGLQLGFLAGEEDYRMVDPINPLPISGTVTANSSNGSLTTRFGSVVTANTAFATSAVTNANRKYLLIQNVTTASNVITVGIGFTPTTTQGIQLFAGAGLTFEGSYIPTGAVNLLSSVTASCYTILEA